MIKLGETLKRLRREYGLSQEQLAAQLGISRQAVSKWEADQTQPDLDSIARLCEIFGISADELLGLKMPQPEPPSTEPPSSALPPSVPPDAPPEQHAATGFDARVNYVFGIILNAVGWAGCVVLFMLSTVIKVWVSQENEAGYVYYDNGLLGNFKDFLSWYGLYPMLVIFVCCIAVGLWDAFHYRKKMRGGARVRDEGK